MLEKKKRKAGRMGRYKDSLEGKGLGLWVMSPAAELSVGL